MDSIVVMMRARGTMSWQREALTGGKKKHFEATSFPGCIWAACQLFCSWRTCYGTAGNGYNSPVIKTTLQTTQHTNQWFNNCVNETDYSIGFRVLEALSAFIFCLWERAGLPLQTHPFPSSTFILKLPWLQLLYQNILEHHMLLRPVFIDIYGSARKFQWVKRGFPHSVCLGLLNLSLAAVLSPWGVVKHLFSKEATASWVESHCSVCLKAFAKKTIHVPGSIAFWIFNFFFLCHIVSHLKSNQGFI